MTSNPNPENLHNILKPDRIQTAFCYLKVKGERLSRHGTICLKQRFMKQRE